MVEIGQLAFDLIIGLLTGVIQEGVTYTTLPFFERRKIENRIKDAVAEVVEPLLPFLEQEKIPEDKQRRLIQTCVDELGLLTTNPEPLFQGSLDGQKIFEQLYEEHDLPQVVVEDGLKDIYTLLCPRVATLLCKIPAAVKDWENEAWAENYRRLDEITTQLRQLFNTVDEISSLPSTQADELLATVRRSLAQKVRLELDLTGLRADRPLEGKFDNFFVHPELQEIADKENPQRIKTAEDSFRYFTSPAESIVVGPAGAGKSTWAKWLQRETLAPNWGGISIRVELRRFTSRPALSLHDLIREAAGKHIAEDVTAERIGHWLDARQVIFILDGFDEIRPSERDNVCEWIVDLHLAARNCPFILTSRPLTTDHLKRFDANWQQWAIESFDKPRIIDYIQRWYNHIPVLSDDNRIVDAEELASAWRGDPTIAPLTGNPLLLSTLLMVHHLDGNLPSGRSQLYRRYVEGMLGIWDDRRKVSATSLQLSLEQKKQILRGFALRLFFEGQDQLDETAALEWLEEFLQKLNLSSQAADILSLLRERSGLIIGPGIYSFAHKSIAEYLVTEAVLQGDQRDTSGTRIDRFRLFEHRDDDRWNTVTFLWAGLAPIADVEAFVEGCLEAGSWSLAYGIMLDQYNRIPIDIRRKFLLQSSNLQNYPDDKGAVFWGVSQPASMQHMTLEIPSFYLRGLKSHMWFHRFIEKAIHDDTLTWEDNAALKGDIRDITWMTCATNIDNINAWKSCLSSNFPQNGSSLLWLFWIAESTFRQAVSRQPSNLQTIISAYKETRPEAKGLVPIALITVALLPYLTAMGSTDKIDHQRVCKILEVLPDSNESHVIPEWLIGTYEWIDVPDNNIGDLLIGFIELLKSLAEEGHVEPNLAYQEAMKFVEELQKLRKSFSATI